MAASEGRDDSFQIAKNEFVTCLKKMTTAARNNSSFFEKLPTLTSESDEHAKTVIKALVPKLTELEDISSQISNALDPLTSEYVAKVQQLENQQKALDAKSSQIEADKENLQNRQNELSQERDQIRSGAQASVTQLEIAARLQVEEVKTELDQARKEHNKLSKSFEEQLDTTKAYAKLLETTNTELSARDSQHSRERDALTQAKDAAIAKAEAAQRALDDIQASGASASEAALLNAKYQAKEEVRAEYQELKAAKDQQLDRLKKDCEEQTSKIRAEDLKDKEVLRTRIDRLDQEVKDMIVEKGRFEVKIATLTESLKNVKLEHTKAMELQKDTHADIVDDWKRRLDAEQSRSHDMIAAIKEQEASLIGALARFDQRDLDYANSNSTLLEAREVMDREIVDQIKSEIAASHRLATSFVENHEERQEMLLNSFQTNMHMAQTEWGTAEYEKRVREDAEAYFNEKWSSNEMLQQIQAALPVLAQFKNEYEKTLLDLEALQVKYDDQKEEIREARGVLVDRDTHVDAKKVAEANLEHVTRRLEAMQTERDNLKSELSNMKSALDQSQGRAALLEQQLDVLTKDRDHWKRRAEKCESKARKDDEANTVSPFGSAALASTQTGTTSTSTQPGSFGGAPARFSRLPRSQPERPRVQQGAFEPPHEEAESLGQDESSSSKRTIASDHSDTAPTAKVARRVEPEREPQSAVIHGEGESSGTQPSVTRSIRQKAKHKFSSSIAGPLSLITRRSSAQSLSGTVSSGSSRRTSFLYPFSRHGSSRQNVVAGSSAFVSTPITVTPAASTLTLVPATDPSTVNPSATSLTNISGALPRREASISSAATLAASAPTVTTTIAEVTETSDDVHDGTQGAAQGEAQDDVFEPLNQSVHNLSLVSTAPGRSLLEAEDESAPEPQINAPTYDVDESFAAAVDGRSRILRALHLPEDWDDERNIELTRQLALTREPDRWRSALESSALSMFKPGLCVSDSFFERKGQKSINEHGIVHKCESCQRKNRLCWGVTHTSDGNFIDISQKVDNKDKVKTFSVDKDGCRWSLFERKAPPQNDEDDDDQGTAV